MGDGSTSTHHHLDARQTKTTPTALHHLPTGLVKRIEVACATVFVNAFNNPPGPGQGNTLGAGLTDQLPSRS